MSGATYRADYFDLKKKPQIKFEKATKTWTLSNGEIERVIRFDPKTGSLKTTRFRNLKNGLELVSTLGSEAEISFVAQLRETPKPLTGWRATDKKPADNWTAPDFDAKNWKESDYATGEEQKGEEGWYRTEISKDRLRPDRAYALVLVQPFIDGGEIYVDGVKVFEAKDYTTTPIAQIDLPANSRVIALHCNTHELDLPEARFVGIAEEGTAPPNLDLKQNWRYMIHAINAGQDNSLILSITLSGEKQFQGFELEINYQIHAGGEPTMATWMYLISHRSTRFLIDKVTPNRWQSRDAQIGAEKITVSPHKNRGWTGATLGKAEGILVKPDTRIELPHSLVIPYTGSPKTGQFLLQLYRGEYLAKGKPGALPVTYVAELQTEERSSRSEDATELKDAKALEAQIPLAVALGIQTFVAGNGWQTTLTGNAGGYGDWTADRKLYPEGLAAFSLKVREAKMNFGLWLDPSRVSVDSKAFLDHPDWLVQRADRSSREETDLPIFEYYFRNYYHPSHPTMCLPSGWMSSLSLSMAAFLKELSVTTLITSGDPIEEICLNPSHEHTLLHAGRAQEEQWRLFADKIQGANVGITLMSDENLPDAILQQVEGSMNSPDFPAFTKATELGNLFVDRLTPEETIPRFVSEVFGRGATPIFSGDLRKLTATNRTELTQWIARYQAARPWLAYSLDGLSLRPAVEDRYGYLYLTDAISRNSKPSLPTEINASDYFVKLEMSRLELISVRTGKPVPFVKKENGFVLTNSMTDTDPATGWDLIEIRNKKSSSALH